jgi:hypothetical protein
MAEIDTNKYSSVSVERAGAILAEAGLSGEWDAAEYEWYVGTTTEGAEFIQAAGHDIAAWNFTTTSWLGSW